MTETIYLAASSDDNYAQHVGVMLQSLLRNTQTPESICCYLISCGISTENQQFLHDVANKFNAQLHIITTDESKYQNLPTLRYGIAAYQRLLLPDYLPDNIEKVIYLDADTLVLDDIRKLWTIDLTGKPLGAVENLSPKACKNLGFKRTEYFNSGMLVIDLIRWRQQNIYKRTLAFIRENLHKLRYFDQCALNYIFFGQWHKLPLRWNQQADIYGVLKKYAQGCGYSTDELRQAITHPGIVHFIGEQKPWMLNCFHPFKKHYRHYLQQTPWAGRPFTDESTSQRIKHIFSIKKHWRQWCRQRGISENENL